MSRYKTQNNILFSNGNLILSDQKGNLIIFSVNENKIFRKYNFYKNRFKDIKKNLNLVIENNIIYISDNIGFFYAYDYLKDKLVWAKNYKVPFRSNLKISLNKLISSNQNNDLIPIVVTHYPPSEKAKNPNRSHDKYSSLYYNNFDVSGVYMWISGHTHYNYSINESGCKLVSNQLGKKKDNIQDYQKNYIIEL